MEELKEEKIRLEQVVNNLNVELRANTERSNKVTFSQPCCMNRLAEWWACVFKYATKLLAADPLSPVSCKVDLFQDIPQILDWIEIWGIWRRWQHIKLFVMFLKPFPNVVLCGRVHYVCVHLRVFVCVYEEWSVFIGELIDGCACLLCGAQELMELRDAKQLLIQQKLEKQGCVESSQAALEQEQREHQATRDSMNRQDEELKKERAHIKGQLVFTPIKTILIHHYHSYLYYSLSNCNHTHSLTLVYLFAICNS